MRSRALLILALGFGRAEPAGQEQEWPYVNEAPAKHVKRFEELAKGPDWRGIFDLYDLAQEKYASTFVRDPKEPRRFFGFAEWIRARILLLAGVENAFRERYDGVAAAAFRAARDARDWHALEQAAERYFLATNAREALDEVAHRRFAEGEVSSAAIVWHRLILRMDPTDALYSVVACRLAAAYALLRDAEGLAGVKSLRATGTVLVGGRTVRAEEYIGSLQFESAPHALPDPDWEWPGRARAYGPACEVFLGTASLARDAGGRTTGLVRTRGLFVRHGGRDRFVVTTGRRIVAFDPMRGDGQSLDAGVLWRWPESGPVRGDLNLAMQFGAVFGLAQEGDLVVATMLGDHPPTTVQRRVPFDAATRIVGVDLRTGREKWDTAKLRTTFRGREVHVFEPLGFGDREFGFTCPPVLWEGRVYAALQTHPSAERETYVVCLDAATGRPRWATSVAAGQPNLPVTQPTLIVDRRGIFVSTNVGAVAALDPASGAPRWMTSYPVVARSRVPLSCPPALVGGRLFVFPQDGNELLSFDAINGRRLPVSWINRRDSRLDWSRVGAVTPIAPGLLVATGDEIWLLNVAEMKWNSLIGVQVSWYQSPPVLVGKSLFVAYGRQGCEGVVVYEAESWRLQTSHAWAQSSPNCELIAGGEYVAMQSKDVRVYTGLAALEARYSSHVDLDPPVPETCLRLAKILREAGRWPNAVRAYERFFVSAEGDPRWAAQVAEARRWIADKR